MQNIKLSVEYDGTHFKGWQIQKKGERTVQGEILKAIKIITKEDVKLIGSGRTDTGVHALGQISNFITKSLMTTIEIQRSLNGILPEDISIKKVDKVSLKFHAQHDAKSKVYSYCLLNSYTRSPICRSYFCYYRNPLDIRLMREEAKSLIGTIDFRSFQSSNASTDKNKSTVRHVKKCTISKKNQFITINIEANGFLYRMVRNIVGTLINIGSGRLSQGSMKKILAKKSRIYASDTAKPLGLTLLKVKY